MLLDVYGNILTEKERTMLDYYYNDDLSLREISDNENAERRERRDSGEQQLREYLDYFQLDMGYMLSFNFNKNKKQGIERVQVGDKPLIEATL